MKIIVLKKKLLSESMIVVSALAVLAGVAYYLSMLSGDYEDDNGKLHTQIASVTNETNGLRSQYAKVKENKALYELVIQKNNADELSVNRQSIRTKFDEFKSQYYLSNVHLSISAVQELPGTKYKNVANAIVQSDVSVTFDALNDEYVYGLLQSIRDDFPGITRVTKLTIRRTNKVTDAGLSAIAKTGQYQMVQGEIKFSWMGLKPLEPSITQGTSGDGAGKRH